MFRDDALSNPLESDSETKEDVELSLYCSFVAPEALVRVLFAMTEASKKMTPSRSDVSLMMLA
jgi:hypothetical protein